MKLEDEFHVETQSVANHIRPHGDGHSDGLSLEGVENQHKGARTIGHLSGKKNRQSLERFLKLNTNILTTKKKW